ncbi:MAG: MMPL family transporter [Gammaproteobacteria bacterium]
MRWWLILVLVAFAVLAALRVVVEWPSLRPSLRVDPSIRALLPASGPDLALLEAVRERYASDDLLLVVWRGDALFTPDTLAAFKRLTRRIERLPGVAHVESLASALQIRVFEDFTEVGAYLGELPRDVTAARAVRDAVLANPLYAGYLAARDGRGALIAVRLERGLAAAEQIALVSAVGRASASEAGAVEQFLSGPLFVRLEISRLLLADLYHVLPLAIGVTLLVAALGFRHWRGVLLPLAANASALTLTLAAFVATGHALNYVTVMLPPTVYVVGFAYALHVVADFDRHFARGSTRAQAVRCALADVARPLGLTALTTIAGFAALATSAIPSIRTFGLFAALGTALAWAAALTVVPAGLALAARAPRSPRASRAAPLVPALARLARTRRGALLAAGALLVAVSLAGIGRLEVNTDYLANFAPSSAVRGNFDRLNAAFAGAVPLQVVLEADATDAFKTPAALRELDALARWLEAQPEIGGVYTLLDYIAELERALAPELVDDDPVPPSAAHASHLILLGASDDIRRFADSAFASTLLQVRARQVASAELNALTRRIEARLEMLPADLRGRVTGSSVLIAKTLDDVTHGQVTSLLAALVPIALVLVALFRSLRLALLALLPNVLPIVAFFGILGWSGTPLNLSTSLVAAVVLGIAVDDSIHFFARLEAARRRGGDALEQALAAVLRPVTFTTAGLAFGFATLTTGSLVSQAEFGLLAAATLVLAWLLDLGFTPALAVAAGLDRARGAASDDGPAAIDDQHLPGDHRGRG